MLKRLLKLLLALTLAVGIVFPANAQPEKSGGPASLTVKPEVVTVGFYPINVYGVDPTSSTFTYDGYVWLRWRGELNPSETLEFTNAVSKSSISKVMLYDEPQAMPDGSKYQIMRIESQFFKPFSMSQFPLDNHDLSIDVEDSLRGSDLLRLEIDKVDTKLTPSIVIAGWKLDGWRAQTTVNDYDSNFGDANTAGQASKFSKLSFIIEVERPSSYFIWKLLLPLFVVLCGAWIALLLNPVLTETRAALPASALLTTVFLQQSYNDALPDTGGLVLLDKIYVVAYILIVITLARIIINSRAVEDMDNVEIQRLRTRDSVTLLIQFLIFVFSTLALVYAF
nr:hypothetical protein [uncultured Sphingorhabdus sp.]